MGIINSDKNRKKLGVLYLSILIIAVSSLALSASVVHAQPYVETVKHRNLTIDLGNGLKTNAQLTIPAIGKGPFPGRYKLNQIKKQAKANGKPGEMV